MAPLQRPQRKRSKSTGDKTEQELPGRTSFDSRKSERNLILRSASKIEKAKNSIESPVKMLRKVANSTPKTPFLSSKKKQQPGSPNQKGRNTPKGHETPKQNQQSLSKKGSQSAKSDSTAAGSPGSAKLSRTVRRRLSKRKALSNGANTPQSEKANRNKSKKLISKKAESEDIEDSKEEEEGKEEAEEVEKLDEDDIYAVEVENDEDDPEVQGEGDSNAKEDQNVAKTVDNDVTEEQDVADTEIVEGLGSNVDEEKDDLSDENNTKEENEEIHPKLQLKESEMTEMNKEEKSSLFFAVHVKYKASMAMKGTLMQHFDDVCDVKYFGLRCVGSSSKPRLVGSVVLADECSYRNALKLDGTYLVGRRLKISKHPCMPQPRFLTKVSKLPLTMDEEDVKKRFESAGPLISFSMNKSARTAFIEASDIMTYDNLLKMNLSSLKGKNILVRHNHFFNAPERNDKRKSDGGEDLQNQKKKLKTHECKVFVGSLPYTVSVGELRKHFEQAGGIEHCTIRVSEGKRPTAVVTLSTDAAFQEALKLNGSTLGDTQIRVRESQKKMEEKRRFILYLRKLGFATTKKNVEEHFKSFGIIADVVIPILNGKPWGFACAEVADEFSFKKALLIHGTVLLGHRIDVFHTPCNLNLASDHPKELGSSFHARAVGGWNFQNSWDGSIHASGTGRGNFQNSRGGSFNASGRRRGYFQHSRGSSFHSRGGW